MASDRGTRIALALGEPEVLQAELRDVRAEYDAGRCTRTAVRTAFERWFRACCAAGRPPDALDPRIDDEAERFFAKLVQGPDGHVYWGGPRYFATNDGKHAIPRRWWWIHLHGEPTERVRIAPFCDEENCIFPSHMRAVSWSEIKRRWTDEQVLGSIQVVAMQLGRTPTALEWETARRLPSKDIVILRFGTWNKAMSAAGLMPRPSGVNVAHGARGILSKEDLLRAGVELVHRLGRVPGQNEWSHRNYAPSYSTVRRRFGKWATFLEELRARLGQEST